MIKKLSCVSHGSLKRFPHTFTKDSDHSAECSRHIELLDRIGSKKFLSYGAVTKVSSTLVDAYFFSLQQRRKQKYNRTQKLHTYI